MLHPAAMRNDGFTQPRRCAETDVVSREYALPAGKTGGDGRAGVKSKGQRGPRTCIVISEPENLLSLIRIV